MVKCDRCGKKMRVAKKWKRWQHHRFEGMTFRQRVTLYCSLACSD